MKAFKGRDDNVRTNDKDRFLLHFQEFVNIIENHYDLPYPVRLS
jgi:hypothetical protein